MRKNLLQGCKFLAAAAKPAQFPAPDVVEVAFAGRSNAGKSTLLNALTLDKLAITSRTPGRTQTINFFGKKNEFRLVDLPGYGYADAPKHLADSWTATMTQYIRTRETLQSVFLLVDIRSGLSESDEQLLDVIKDVKDLTAYLVLTKMDRFPMAVIPRKIEEAASSTKFQFEDVLACSSTKGDGIQEVREAVAKELRLI